MNYGIIGVGEIAKAIVAGLCAHGGQSPSILLSPRNALVAAELAERFPTISVAPDNQAVIDGSSVVILCVRPQDAEEILSTLTFAGTSSVVSVMAVVSLQRLRKLVAPARDIARAIPLPSVSTRRGVTPLFPTTAASTALFTPLGGTIDVSDEAAFDALFAATATIAAHFAYLHAIQKWLTGAGIQEQAAGRYVASIFAGLGAALRHGEADFAHLTGEYMTPGGINEQFLAEMEKAGSFVAVESGLTAVFRRLSQKPPD